jgi:hypothetical protein
VLCNAEIDDELSRLRKKKRMRTLKEAHSESDISTAITEDGVIYKDNGNGINASV